MYTATMFTMENSGRNPSTPAKGVQELVQSPQHFTPPGGRSRPGGQCAASGFRGARRHPGVFRARRHGKPASRCQQMCVRGQSDVKP